MGFVAPGLLWLVALAAIPIVIHILSRLRLQRAAFPSLMLLKTVRRERFSWLRLKELLLLVLRTLALLSLLAALARPYLKQRLPGLGRERDLAIVLDDSYSMGYPGRWQQAQDAVRELLKGLGPGRRAMVLLASGQKPGADFLPPGRWLRWIDSLAPSFSAVTLDSAVAAAARAAQLARADVVAVTDLQERAVRSVSAGSSAVPRVMFVDVAEPEFDNAAVARVYAEDRFFVPGRPVRLKADLANYGRRTVTRTVVLSTRESREEKVVSLPAEGRATIEFETVLADSGEQEAMVELRGDPLAADDARWFVATRPSNPKVLVVQSPRVPARYVVDALGADSVSGLRVVVIDAAELGRADLRRHGVVVVTDAAALSGSDWTRLGFHLQSGGAALVMVGPLPRDTTSMRPYFRVRGSGARTGFESVAGLDSTHPVFEPMARADLASARFFDHALLDAPGCRVMMRGSSDAPLAFEAASGRMIVWAFAATPEYTDLVHKAAFVPLLHRSLYYLLSTLLRTEYAVGDTIRVPADPSGRVPVVGPLGRVEVEPVARQGRAVVEFADTRLPGLYRIGTGVVVVNHDPAEGDLARAGEEELKRRGLAVAKSAGRTGSDLSPVLLWLAAFAFAAELLLLV